MVKKIVVFLSILLLATSVLFSAGVRVVIIEKDGISIDKSTKNALKLKLESSVKRQLNLSPDERPAEYGLIFHITDFKKSYIKLHKVYFVYDRNGDYVYFKGNYYKLPWKRLYRYDGKSNRFIPDKDGDYVYLSNYKWAREEREKYIYVGGRFYKKVEKDVTAERYYMSAFLTFVDFKNSFILYQTQMNLSADSLKDLISNLRIKLDRTKFYSEKPTVAFYDPSLSPLSAAVRKYFYEEERYTMYDRSYLNILFKEMKFQDLFTNKLEIGSSIKVARYLVVVKVLKSQYEQIEKTDYLEFQNDVNGAYIGKTPVYVGRYYRYDEKRGYYIDMKNGSYVRVKTGPWEREEKYERAYSFNDLFIENVKYHHIGISVLVMVVDAKTGVLKASKTFHATSEAPIKIRSDRYGSQDGHFKESILISTYDTLGKEISNFVRQYFGIETKVVKAKDKEIVIDAGKNYGVKDGYFFRIVDSGFTQGYSSISKVEEKKSEGNVIRYLTPDSVIKKEMVAVEDFDYSPAIGAQIELSVNTESVDLAFYYSPLNIYSFKTYSVGGVLGYIFNDKGLSGTKYGASVIYYLASSKSLSLGAFAEVSYKDLVGEDGESQGEFSAKAGMRIEFPIFESIFSEGGSYIFVAPSVNVNLTPGLYIGIGAVM